jgi:CBS domain containing-hemolysin-like protein
MVIITLVSLCVTWLVLIGLYSVYVQRDVFHHFDVQRKAEKGEPYAQKILYRESRLASLRALHFMVLSFVTIVFSLCAFSLFNWFALVIILFSLLAARMLSNVSWVRNFFQSYYTRIEPFVLNKTKKWNWLYIFEQPIPIQEVIIESKEALEHVIETSPGVLNTEEKNTIINMLHFDERTVHDIMTVRSQVAFVYANNELGPLMIDELYKTGFKSFPVIEEDVDHIIGMLYLQDLLPLTAQNYGMVSKKMKSEVFYIRDDTTLTKTLMAFTKTRHHLFVVIDKNRQTLGIVTLKDTLEALIGHNLDTLFDQHQDKHLVAQQSLNTSAQKIINV